MKPTPSTPVHRIAFASGQYITISTKGTVFDAVADAISHGRCGLASVEVLFVEHAADTLGLQDFGVFRERVRIALEDRARRTGLH